MAPRSLALLALLAGLVLSASGQTCSTNGTLSVTGSVRQAPCAGHAHPRAPRSQASPPPEPPVPSSQGSSTAAPDVGKVRPGSALLAQRLAPWPLLNAGPRSALPALHSQGQRPLGCSSWAACPTPDVGCPPSLQVFGSVTSTKPTAAAAREEAAVVRARRVHAACACAHTQL